MAINYTSVPSVQQFKKDSNVALAIRSHDQILHAMDRLLEMASGTGPNRFAILGDLFFTANSWIKGYNERVKTIERGRYQAVLALLDATSKELMLTMGVPSLHKLPEALVDAFGLKNRSENNDRFFNATFFDAQTRETKRIIFRGGQMYRYMLDVPKAPRGLQLLESRHFDSPDIWRPGGSMPLRFFAPFVMSMEREFYVAKHYVGENAAMGSGGIFHSAYFDGPIAMAGTMLVEHGILKGIRGDSGHYKPGNPNMVNALRALRSKGVNLRNVTVYDYLDIDATTNARKMGKQQMMAGPRAAGPAVGAQNYNQAAVLPPLNPTVSSGSIYNVEQLVSGDISANQVVTELYNGV